MADMRLWEMLNSLANEAVANIYLYNKEGCGILYSKNDGPGWIWAVWETADLAPMNYTLVTAGMVSDMSLDAAIKVTTDRLLDYHDSLEGGK